MLGAAAGGGAATLRMGSVSAVPGQTVALPVVLETGGTQITALQFDVSYEAAKLVIGASTGPTAVSAGKNLAFQTLAGSGVARFLVYGFDSSPITDGEVVTLNITVAAGAGSGTTTVLNIANPVATDSMAQAVSLAAGSAGLVTVAATTTTGQNGAAVAARFVPVRPCRIADTRNAAGAFGGPALAGGAARTFAIPQSACGVPGNAEAYALNVTVVPSGPLGYITVWPAGRAQPLVSTLNSPAGGVVANAAIVPAGDNGAINVFATDKTHLVLDINGYFAAPDNPAGLVFYPVTPCRVADTRNASGAFGGPSMAAGAARNIPIQASGCGIPATAQAYSLNATVVPKRPLGFLTLWPAGQTMPVASTLNSPAGGLAANAAIVPAGTGGAVSAFATDDTELVLDVNGYFAAVPVSNAGGGGLSFFKMTPCRVYDSRSAAGATGGAMMAGLVVRTIPVTFAGGCGVPETAQAFSLNATVVPKGGLGYLSLWPAGAAQPLVSTLNSPGGLIVANAAIVPAGTAGAVSVYATDGTHLILDINGYFAPAQ
jgi:hypothetical protein